MIPTKYSWVQLKQNKFSNYSRNAQTHIQNSRNTKDILIRLLHNIVHIILEFWSRFHHAIQPFMNRFGCAFCCFSIEYLFQNVPTANWITFWMHIYCTTFTLSVFAINFIFRIEIAISYLFYVLVHFKHLGDEKKENIFKLLVLVSVRAYYVLAHVTEYKMIALFMLMLMLLSFQRLRDFRILALSVYFCYLYVLILWFCSVVRMKYLRFSILS